MNLKNKYNLDMKKILILGGGIAQIELIKTAKKLGMQTIVVGSHGDYPGYELADKVYNVDIRDKEAVLEIAINEKIDGVSMVCSDFGLQTLGYVCDQLNLKGLSEKSAIISGDKLLMKEVMIKHNIPTAKFSKVRNMCDLESAIEYLKFPLMVKAVDLQGSKGIFKCHTSSEVREKYELIKTLSRHQYCIIEEFLEGLEFGVQAYVYDGEIFFIEPHGDIILKRDDISFPIGHYMPFNNAQIDNDVKTIVTKAIKVMGFDNCAVNVDLILVDNKPYIIELTGRAGANGLADITSEYFNIDYYTLILLGAINAKPREYWKSHRVSSQVILSRQIFSNFNGKVKHIEYTGDKNINRCTLFVKEGDAVRKFNNSGDCIGKVLCKADVVTQCIKKTEEFISNSLKIELDATIQ